MILNYNIDVRNSPPLDFYRIIESFHNDNNEPPGLRQGVRGPVRWPRLRTANMTPPVISPRTPAADKRFAMRYETHFADRMIRCFRRRPTAITAMLRDAVERAPKAEALVYDGVRVSYRDLDRISAAVAGRLQGLGVVAGDRVGLLLRNRPEFVFVLLGALRLGAIAVPINAREQGTGIGLILADCGATAVITENDLLDRLPEPGTVPALRLVFAADGAEGRARDVAELLEPGPTAAPHKADEEDTAIILYTSGTTGSPKGAMLTHLNLIHSTMVWQQAMGLEEGERSILAVPGSHVTGLVGIVLSMIRVAGCTLIMGEFKAARFNLLASEERATSTVMVPAMYNLCLLSDNFREVDLSRWRVGAFGGAPMPEATIERFAGALPHLKLMNCYGATETSTLVTAMPPEQQADHLDSIGRAVGLADILVMDENGRELPPGEHGELWISGPLVIPGYWNNEKASGVNFQSGFWKSGDIGSIDAQGFVRLHDRIKDMIIRGGYNIYSVEVENVLSFHPQVVECAVVGRPDPVLGEKIHAFVYRQDGDDDETTLKAFCAKRLADYKIPDFITFFDHPLPRNANGKLIKRALREAGNGAVDTGDL